jgi:hypothetical protein
MTSKVFMCHPIPFGQTVNAQYYKSILQYHLPTYLVSRTNWKCHQPTIYKVMLQPTQQTLRHCYECSLALQVGSVITPSLFSWPQSMWVQSIPILNKPLHRKWFANKQILTAVWCKVAQNSTSGDVNGVLPPSPSSATNSTQPWGLCRRLLIACMSTLCCTLHPMFALYVTTKQCIYRIFSNLMRIRI